MSNVFKIIYSQIENFHRESKFLTSYNKIWVLQNVDLVIENMNTINRKKKAKSIATYDFTTLHTTLPHDKLIKRLCNVIDFVFWKVEIEHTFVFPKIMLHTGETSPKTT